MARMPVRSAALQVGEFAVGVTVAYAAIGAAWAVSHSIWPIVLAAVVIVAAAWSLSHAIWPLLLAAAVVVAAAVMLELRYGAKATGLVVGMMPTSLLAAGLLVAVSLVVYRLN